MVDNVLLDEVNLLFSVVLFNGSKGSSVEDSVEGADDRWRNGKEVADVDDESAVSALIKTSVKTLKCSIELPSNDVRSTQARLPARNPRSPL